VTAEYAEDNLQEVRQAGACLAFNGAGDTDLTITMTDRWEEVAARFPPGWQPDFIFLFLPYHVIPPCLWQAPVPVIGFAGDWTLLWHGLQLPLSWCDFIFTDWRGAETMAQAGLPPALFNNMYGCPSSWAEKPWPKVPRDIDILFVGSFQSAIHRDRLPWLGRLAGLGRRWNVMLATKVYGDDYRQLLARARIVFNYSIRGECNQRVGETLAAGALLFQEEDNADVHTLAGLHDCVYYREDNLEGLLTYYLEHEGERQRLAETCAARVREFTFAPLWQEYLELLEGHWDQIAARRAGRQPPGPEELLRARLLTQLSSPPGGDPGLGEELARALATSPRSASLWNAAGALAAHAPPEAKTKALAAAPAGFQNAWQADPGHVVAGLNLTEVMIDLGQKEAAVEQARRTLAMLDRLPALKPQVLQAEHYPPQFDTFRVEWEKAGWANVGRPRDEERAKRTLVRRQLHLVLAELTGGLPHYFEAALARPDLPVSQAALGCALARAGRLPEAIPHLRLGLAGNPFDIDAARALGMALQQTGQTGLRIELAEERRLLSKAAPALVPLEEWYWPEHPPTPWRFRSISQEAFREHYGQVDTARALIGFTPAEDTQAVLTLLAHPRPERILEIGTAAGHMTANLTEWSSDTAQVFSLGIVKDMPVGTTAAQRYEDPPAEAFGRQANFFGKADKVLFLQVDSLFMDFRRIARLDFAFIDGAHDREHVFSDSLRVYDVLRPGGYLVWHDFGSTTPWVEVHQALEHLPFAEAIVHVEGTQVAFLRKESVPEQTAPEETRPHEQGNAEAQEGAGLPQREGTTPLPEVVIDHPDTGPVCRIAWEGSQDALHSMALVNREICSRLVRAGYGLSLVPPHQPMPGTALPLPPELQQGPRPDGGSTPDVHIAHQWPPNWTPPPVGHWIVMQPWEFGSLPRAWLEPLARQVDEVWVYSRFLRDCYVRSGVPAERVAVIPLGVDPAGGCPRPEPLPLQTAKRFKFLFVGGTIHRKGIDLLLSAYTQVFSRRDEVCLVIKDMGQGSFYQGQTAQQLISRLREHPEAPEVEYLADDLPAEDMHRLYAACDCLVHPYRGEGFGLPIAEAMAHGLPVIVTGYGPALDFCSSQTAYLLPAALVRFAEKRIDRLETVDYPLLAEPDLDALRHALRQVFEDPAAARARGAKAREFIRQHFTWDHTVRAVAERLRVVRGNPAVRFQGPNLPAPVIPQAPTGTARISLCMIAKNEADNLPACLQSVRDLVDEVVVVDTGSSDRTREVAAGLGAKVVEFSWCDDFAAARNESLRHATGDWVFLMDGDERLDEENRQRFRALRQALPEENVAFVMRQSSPLEPGLHGAAHVDQVRLFRRHPQVRWRYRIHEQILGPLREVGAEVRPTDIVIHHEGFADPAIQDSKVERNLRLLQLAAQEQPEDSFILYNLGAVYLTRDRAAEALDYLRRSLKHSCPTDNLVPKLHTLIVRAHQQLGEADQAWQVCQAGRQAFPQDPELLFWEAVLREERGDWTGAEACLFQVLKVRRGSHFTSMDTGLQGYRTRNFLAELYRKQGRLADAEVQWRGALADHPGFLPAWRGLADVALRRERWPAFAEALSHLRHNPQEAANAELLQARAHLARQEFALARTALESLLVQAPSALAPKIILSYVLLQEGKDAPAAERVLRDILALDPTNAEARHNLQVLLRQQGRQPDPQANGEVLPDVVVPAAGTAYRPGVSLCMIVKNEEANLASCLETVADLVQEIVVVDTGSTDQTREIARRFGARVHEFPWVDDFAAARNESLKHASCRWVFWMDADDRLDGPNRSRLKGLFAALHDKDENAAYVMKCYCLPDPISRAPTVVDHLRLFRNYPQLRWRYRVHEQILPALRAMHTDVRWSDVVIEHTGYQDPALRRRKLERDLRLLHLDQLAHPDDPFILFNLGMIYQELGQQAQAVSLFTRSLERSQPGDSIVRKLYALIAQCHNQLGQKTQALAACRQGRALFPDDAELLFQEGLILQGLGDSLGAVERWEQVLRCPPGQHFASVHAGIRGYLTRQNLAAVYQTLGRFPEAERHYQAILEEQPDYQTAWLGLGELYLAQARWHELSGLEERLGGDAEGKFQARLLRGRGLLAQKEFAAARELLQALIAEHPTRIESRVVLSYTFLQEGKDWQAAERALLAVLELDPDHKEARHNLAVLRSQKRGEAAS
jgi:glycosyltransferase involved in cell wall biosynthesis/SAM-dependent methyltransferase